MNPDLYFSRARVAFSKEGRAAARGATRSYLVHQAVCGLFGSFDERPYLYRSDECRDNVETVLVLSTEDPRRVSRPSGHLWFELEALETKRFPDALPQGARFDFELRLNATKDLPGRPGTRSKRVDVWEAVWRDNRETPVEPHDVYRSYLQRRLEGIAHIESARVTERGLVKVRRSLQAKAPITFVATNMIGTLTVLDPVQLRERIASGIGRSRSLGCGLLCLSRPGTVLARRHASTLHTRQM